MKKTLHVVLPVLAIFIAVVGFASVYAATSYKTYASIGAGYSLTGSARNYSAGTPQLEFNINYFNKYNGQNYSRLLYRFLTSNGQSLYETQAFLATDLIGQDVVLVNDAPTVKAGSYKWYFTTKINGTTYSGFYMNPLYLKTV